MSPDGRLMAVPIRAQGLEFEHGTPIALFKTRLSGGFGGLAGNTRPQYNVGVDGRFVMNVAADDPQPPIIILLNWRPPASDRGR